MESEEKYPATACLFSPLQERRNQLFLTCIIHSQSSKYNLSLKASLDDL